MTAASKKATDAAVDANTALRELDAEVTDVLVLVDGVTTITDTAQYAAFADVLVDVLARKRILADLKKGITKPIRDAEKATRDLFRPVEEKIEALEKQLRDAMERWQEEQREAVKDARELLRVATTAEDRTAAMEELVRLGAVAETEAKAPPAATTSAVWTFEVDDPALVPREYMIVDESAIRNAMHGGARSIPGVRIYQKLQVSAKPKKAPK